MNENTNDFNQQRLAKLRLRSTRQLLRMLRDSYGCYEDYYGYYYTSDEIKAVLQTREHIPNKIEGEKTRQAKAKTRKEARNNRYMRRR